jgi:sulfoxide reductase catalytic subunit YedY
MANRWTNTLKDSDVTPEAMYLNRRQLIAGAAGAGFVSVVRRTSRWSATSPRRAR